MNDFLSGAIMMGNLVLAMFFARFYRRTGDRFFALFATAFVTFSIARVLLTVVDEVNEERAYVYLVRLAAFAIILIAVVDKNRQRGRP
jgi:hypothetical protein